MTSKVDHPCTVSMKLTKDQRELIVGRPIYASLSGGKDSTALALWLRENDVPFTAFFCDTGWEHPDTYDYLAYLQSVIGPIKTIKSEKAWSEIKHDQDTRNADPMNLGGLPTLALKKSFFPRGAARWCTLELKVEPVREYLTAQRMLMRAKPINAVGIRAAESQSRSLMTEIDEHDESTTWRPIIRWDEQLVIDTLKRHGVRPNPLYLRGAARVGCFPCIYARKSEIKHIVQNDPWRIDQIRIMEERVSATKGRASSFFGARIKSHAAVMPIDEIAKWSVGPVDDMFADIPEEQGCMRWGLCESLPRSLQSDADKDEA